MTISKREALTATSVRSYPRGEDWRADVACAPDDWLWIDHKPSEEPEALTEARTICGACPARTACLAYALADPSLDGIWAGTSATERRRMRRNTTRPSRAKEGAA